jgi:glutathione S-transferase
MRQALTGPFILRIYSFSKNGILPESVASGLDALPNFSKWAAEVIKHNSVTYMWNEQVIVEGTRKKLAGAKIQSK